MSTGGGLLEAEAAKRSEAALGRESHLRALRQDYGSLRQREREVMTLVVSGLLNKQVGGELGITLRSQSLGFSSR